MAQKKLIDIDLLTLYDGLIKQKIEDETDASETYAYGLVQNLNSALTNNTAIYNDEKIAAIVDIAAEDNTIQ